MYRKSSESKSVSYPANVIVSVGAVWRRHVVVDKKKYK